MRRLLFICSQNCLRSPTAEHAFANREGLETRSAGTDSNAEMPVDSTLIEWAEEIYAMENHHRNKLTARFGSELLGKRLVVLGIPDRFEYMEPALVTLLEKKMAPYLLRPSSRRETIHD